MEVRMATENEIKALVESALEAENDWRYRGPEGRRAAYDRFQGLVSAIADLTGRPYEELLNEAIEEWVVEHFCSLGGDEVNAAS
jgi:hypothetical protein